MIDAGTARSSPVSSTATPTWSSPATGRPSSPPGWPACPTPAAASGPRSRRPGPPATPNCASIWPAWRRGARARAPRRSRCKSGYGLTVVDEDAACGSPREVTAETTFLGAHVVPAEYADRPTTTSSWSAARCWRRRAPYARWIDVFCERGAFDARPVPRGPRRRDRRRAVGPGCTPTSSARAAACGSRSNSAPPVPTTAPTCPTAATSTRWPARPRWPPCCPGPSSAPDRPTRTPAPCSTPARRSRWPPTATPARPTPPPCRSASRSPYGRCA